MKLKREFFFIIPYMLTFYLLLEKYLHYRRFFGPPLVGCSKKMFALKIYVVDLYNKSEHVIRSKCLF